MQLTVFTIHRYRQNLSPCNTVHSLCYRINSTSKDFMIIPSIQTKATLVGNHFLVMVIWEFYIFELVNCQNLYCKFIQLLPTPTSQEGMLIFTLVQSFEPHDDGAISTDLDDFRDEWTRVSDSCTSPCPRFSNMRHVTCPCPNRFPYAKS